MAVTVQEVDKVGYPESALTWSFQVLPQIVSRVCLPLLDTSRYTYTLISLNTQKLVYATWGLCWNNFELSSFIFPSKLQKVWGESDQGLERPWCLCCFDVMWSCGWGHGDVRRRLMGCGAWTGNWPLWAAALHLVGSGGGRAGALPYGGAGSCAPHLSCWSQTSDWCSRCKRDSCQSCKHHFSPLWSLKSMMQLSRFNLFHALPLYNSSISSRKTSSLTRNSFCIPFYLLVEIAWIVAASLSRIW